MGHVQWISPASGSRRCRHPMRLNSGRAALAGCSLQAARAHTRRDLRTPRRAACGFLQAGATCGTAPLPVLRCLSAHRCAWRERTMERCCLWQQSRETRWAPLPPPPGAPPLAACACAHSAAQNHWAAFTPLPQDLLPLMSVSASALSALAGAASRGGAAAAPLRIAFAATNTYQLTALVKVADPLAGARGSPTKEPSAATVQCKLLDTQQAALDDRSALAAAGGGDDALAAVLAARLDAHGPASIAEVRGLSLQLCVQATDLRAAIASRSHLSQAACLFTREHAS